MDYEIGRCLICDSRYCYSGCFADNPAYVYVTGQGWTHWEKAARFEEAGHRVDWRRSRVPA